MNNLITLARKDAADRDCPYFVRDTLVLCADAIEAKDAKIARLTKAVDDREASLIRMRDMLNRATQADNERLRSEVKMLGKSIYAKDAEIARLQSRGTT